MKDELTPMDPGVDLVNNQGRSGYQKSQHAKIWGNQKSSCCLKVEDD
jgi:hypothetical protein